MFRIFSKTLTHLLLLGHNATSPSRSRAHSTAASKSSVHSRCTEPAARVVPSLGGRAAGLYPETMQPAAASSASSKGKGTAATKQSAATDGDHENSSDEEDEDDDARYDVREEDDDVATDSSNAESNAWF